MRTLIENLLYGQNDNIYAKNLTYIPQDINERRYGEIYLFATLADGGSVSDNIITTIFETIKSIYYLNTKRDPYDSFEAGLKEVNDVLFQFTQKKSDGFIGQLNAAIVIKSANNLYLSNTGMAECYMHRSGSLSLILEGKDAPIKPYEYFINIASGEVKPNDIILCSNYPLLKYISEETLIDILTQYELKDVGITLKNNLIMSDYDVLSILLLGIKADYTNMIEGNKTFSTYHNRRLSWANNVWYSMKDLFSSFGSKAKSFDTTSIKNVGNKLQFLKFSNLKNSLQGTHNIAGRDIDKRSLFITVSILVIVLIVMVFVIMSQTDDIKQRSETSSILSEVEDVINRSETLMLYDKNTAKQLLIDSKDKLNNLQYIGIYKNNIANKMKRIDDLMAKIDNTKFIDSDTILFADLSSARTNANAKGIIATATNVFAYDYNALYSIILDQVNIQKVVTNDQDEALAGSYFSELNKSIILTKNANLIEIDSSNNIQDIKTEAGKFNVAIDIDTFNRNIYLLDPTSNQIWKYTRKNNIYTKPVAYNINADLRTAVSIAIDGSVWVLRNDGVIIKMVKGEKQDFEHKGINPPMRKPTKIRTTQEGIRMYILDSETNSIIVINKNKGDYMQKYTIRKLEKNLKDIALDKSETFLYAMTEDKVYRIDLRK